MDDRVISSTEDSESSTEDSESSTCVAEHPEAVERHSQNQPMSKDNLQFFAEVKDGLKQAQKTLPCKYFYDEKGSLLFEKICQLDEYYITRTELALLEEIKSELAEKIGKNATIIEPGAGAGIKIRTLLSALDSPESYVPMDISKDFLYYSAKIIQDQFPNIDILPIQGDFTQPVQWLGKENKHNRVVFFPGSTIGNFDKTAAIDFLVNMHDLIGQDGALIIGADLLKEAAFLEAAYNDQQGVTAAFNKNLLTRINQNLNGDFDLSKFSHKAILNHEHGRIEMHLFSHTEQLVNINSEQFEFAKDESIHTENSHKYTVESFLQMADAAGLRCEKTWLDQQHIFSVHYLVQK